MMEFLRRNRRSIVWACGSSVAIGASVYLLQRYVRGRLTQWATAESHGLLMQLQRQQHFDTTRATCAGSCKRLARQLCDSLTAALPTDHLLAQLRHLTAADGSGEVREQRVALWQQLKRLALQRVVCSVYTAVYLVVGLQLHSHALAAVLASTSSSPSSDDGDSSGIDGGPMLSPDEQHQYLMAMDQFVVTALPTLVQRVGTLTASLADSLPLSRRLSLADIDSVLRSATDTVAATAAGLRMGEFVQQPVAAPTKNSSAAPPSGRLAQLRAETNDILGGDEINALCSECVAACREYALDVLAPVFVVDSAQPSQKQHKQDMLAGSLPTAKLVPILCNLMTQLLAPSGGDSQGGLVEIIGNHTRVQAMASSVYESFSTQ